MSESTSYIVYAVIQALFYIAIAAGIVFAAIAFWKIAKAQESLALTARLVAQKLDVAVPENEEEEDEENTAAKTEI